MPNLGSIIICATAWILSAANPAHAAESANPPESLIRGRTVAPLSTQPVSWPRHVLTAESIWHLDLPGVSRFDASGLLLKDGALLIVNDRGPAIYRIQFQPGQSSASMVRITNYYSPSQVLAFTKGKELTMDCEGLAMDAKGRIYIPEETSRRIFRSDPTQPSIEPLPIDWTPVKKHFHPIDKNASFEGIAIGGDRLYVANERQLGRIIVVDLKDNQIIGDFIARPSTGKVGDIHYSDLSWFDGHLYALLRHHRCVLKIDPETHAVLAEYQFREIEEAPEVAYRRLYPTGTMEGLAVEEKFIWLVTDSNGNGRAKYPKDLRPTLFKCPKPD